MRQRRWIVLAAALLVAASTGCAATAAPTATASGPAATATATASVPAASATATPETTSLLDAIGDRLLASEAVAAVKRAAGLPIDDPSREEAVIAAAGDAAAAAGVDPARAETVVRGQIAASKAAQRAYLELWASGAADPPSDPSLDDARTAITAATTAIVTGLARPVVCPLDPVAVAAVAARLTATGLDASTSSDVVEQATGPLCP